MRTSILLRSPLLRGALRLTAKGVNRYLVTPVVATKFCERCNPVSAA
jgi:hypothetical protein